MQIRIDYISFFLYLYCARASLLILGHNFRFASICAHVSVVSAHLKTDATLSICAGSAVFLKKKKFHFG
jgi:branched-subunit amino acid transport protein AzlD